MSKEVVTDNKSLSLSPADLQAMIAAAVTAAVAEAKKPIITDQDKAEIEQRQQERQANAGLELEKISNKRIAQRNCIHKQSQKAGGNTHCVFIQNGQYILCQACQAKVRNGAKPENYQGTDIYDSDLFMRLLQECISTAGGDLIL